MFDSDINENIIFAESFIISLTTDLKKFGLKIELF